MDKKELINLAIKIVVILLVVIAVIVITSKFVSYIKGNVRNAQLTVEANREIDPSLLKMTETDRQACVSKLKLGFYSGLFNWAEDEELIYDAFEMIPTRSDLLAVSNEFGVMNDKTLAEHVNGLMSREEIEHINAILRTNNINFAF